MHKDSSLLEDNDLTRLEENKLIDKVALVLRNAILKMEKLPSKIKATTGKPVSKHIAEFLLNVEENDNNLLQDDDKPKDDDDNENDSSDEDDYNYQDASVGCALMNATTTASQIVHMTSGRVREIGYLKTGLPEMLVFLTLLALVLFNYCKEILMAPRFIALDTGKG
ncbi:unnamed protein product [Leptidea sinapis]|uniref:Uncharacterized protein n=1 Tax=Leptidea sinapis TaxID=189913 RepID=A0A5E4QWG9_9NEOP|nr:unnamed protein product [Leptidea sinapis]